MVMNDILRQWGGVATLNYKPAVGGDLPFSKEDAWKQSQWCFDVITQDGLLRARHPRMPLGVSTMPVTLNDIDLFRKGSIWNQVWHGTSIEAAFGILVTSFTNQFSGDEILKGIVTAGQLDHVCGFYHKGAVFECESDAIQLNAKTTQLQAMKLQKERWKDVPKGYGI